MVIEIPIIAPRYLQFRIKMIAELVVKYLHLNAYFEDNLESPIQKIYLIGPDLFWLKN